MSKDQKNRYKKALFTSNELPEFDAVDLVYKDNESEVDKYLLDELKKLKEEHYWLANEFIKRLKYKNNSTEMTDLLKKYNELRFEKNKSKELKEIIDKFISLVERPATNIGV